MAEPSYLSNGTSSRISDTRLTRWTRILGALQNRDGANPNNNPHRRDTRRAIAIKIVKSLTGA
jgi:hypothetical protein